MLLAECSESISHNHTAHIKKCPDSIVGKRQRPQAFLIYSYVISTAIGTWHSVLQSQHTDKCGIIAAHCCWCIVHNIWYSVVLLFVRGQQQGMPNFRVSTSCGLLWKQVNIQAMGWPTLSWTCSPSVLSFMLGQRRPAVLMCTLFVSYMLNI